MPRWPIISSEQWHLMYLNAWKFSWNVIDESWDLKEKVYQMDNEIRGLKEEIKTLKGGNKMYTLGSFNLDFACDDSTQFIITKDGESYQYDCNDIPAELYDKGIKSVRIVPEVSGLNGQDKILCCYFDLEW